MTLPLNALTPRSRAVFVLAAEIAEDAGHGYVGTEHLSWLWLGRVFHAAHATPEQLAAIGTRIGPALERANPAPSFTYPGITMPAAMTAAADRAVCGSAAPTALLRRGGIGPWAPSSTAAPS